MIEAEFKNKIKKQTNKEKRTNPIGIKIQDGKFFVLFKKGDPQELNEHLTEHFRQDLIPTNKQIKEQTKDFNREDVIKARKRSNQ